MRKSAKIWLVIAILLCACVTVLNFTEGRIPSVILALVEIAADVYKRQILDGVIQHTYKVGIRQVVEHHDQRAENGGNRQCGDCFGNRGLFKEQGSVLLQGISSPEKSFRAPVFPALSRENRCALAIIILPYSGQSVKLEE